MSVYSVLVSGLPESATMGGVENLIYDKTTGRIVAITLQGAGKAVIELAEEADANNCVGEYEMAGAAVRMAHAPSASDASPPSAPPSSAKRTRSGAAIEAPAPVQVLAPPPPEPLEPSPGSVELISNSGSSTSSSTIDASAARLNAAAGAYDGAAVGTTVLAPASLEQPNASDALMQCEPIDAAQLVIDGAGGPPAVKKIRSSDLNKHGKEKERRLNRVGLSYRCGRCGQPKKGHTCVGEAEGMDEEGAASGEGGAPLVADASGIIEAAIPQPPKKKSKAAKAAAAAAAANAMATPPPTGNTASADGISPTSQMYLDSDSIFKDIKSVLQQPSGGSANGGSAGKASGGAAKGGSGEGGEGKKRKRPSKGAKAAAVAAAAAVGVDLAGEMPPPPAVPFERNAEKSALLEELDLAMQRPPSVITPEESDSMRTGVGPSSLTAAPSSLVSASDMFSPGQLMTHLLGTPTPALTPGLSPGTLNELGNMLQSPGAMLASAQKGGGAVAAAPVLPPAEAMSVATPGQA